jgi:polysaccharide export outer membrane protein
MLLSLSFWMVAGCSNGAAVREAPQTQYVRPPSTPAAPVWSPDSAAIAVGDSVAISVWDYPQFTTQAVVKTNGTIAVPLVGDLTAVGLTRAGLSAELKRRLGDYIQGDIRLSVSVFGALPRILVLGTVPTQGSIPTTGEMTLIDVIGKAGGLQEQSDLRYIQITRCSPLPGEQVVIEVDLEYSLLLGAACTTPMVRPGDIVYVPQRVDYVRKVADFFWAALAVLGVIGLLQ